jgi:hypothetical protein
VQKVFPDETVWIPYAWQTVTVVVYENEMDLQYIYLVAYENIFDNTALDNRRYHYTWIASKAVGTWQFSCPLGSTYIDTAGCSVQEDPSENTYTATFKVRVAKFAAPTGWDLYARAVDNASLDHYLENANAVMVQVYLEMDVSTNALSFIGYPGQSVSPSQGPTSVNTTTNVAFKIGVKVAGNWVSDGNTMPASATKAKGEGDWVSLSTTYQNVWYNITYGESIQKDIEWRLDIPDGVAPGTYTNTFYVRVETIGEQNIVRNPSFEDGEYFWNFASKVFRTDEVVRSGSWSAKQENFGTSYEAELSTDNIFAIKPGENYYLVGYYYLVNPGGGAIPENYTLFFRVRWYYENGTYTQIPGSGSPATVFDKWTKVSFQMQAPTGAVRARIYITAKKAYTATPSTKVYWDDLWLSTQPL